MVDLVKVHPDHKCVALTESAVERFNQLRDL